MPPAAAALLGLVGDDALGGDDVLGDRGGVLERRAGDHGRVDDAGLDQVHVLAGVDVEADAGLLGLDLADDHRALQAGVLGQLAKRLLEGAAHDVGAGRLVAGQLEAVEGLDRVDQDDAATGDDALLEGGAGRLQGVLDAVLALLHLGLGGRADLHHGHAAGQLGQALLELLAVEVRVGGLDLGLDLLDAALDLLGVAGAVDDGGGVLGDHDLAGPAELGDLGVGQLEAHLLGDHLAAGEDGDVLEHALAPVAKARRLDGDAGEGAAQLVDDQGRQGLALDVLGDDQQRPALADDLLEQRQDVLDARDLAAVDEQERVIEHGLHAVLVGDHVGAHVAAVELHALGELEVHAEGLALLDVDHAVLADLLDRVGDDIADGAVAAGDGGDPGDVLLARDLLGLLGDLGHDDARRRPRCRA